MGFDTVSFSSYENMRAMGRAKRRCGRPAHGDVENGRIEAKEGVEMTQWLLALEEEGALQRLARFPAQAHDSLVPRTSATPLVSPAS